MDDQIVTPCNYLSTRLAIHQELIFFLFPYDIKSIETNVLIQVSDKGFDFSNGAGNFLRKWGIARRTFPDVRVFSASGLEPKTQMPEALHRLPYGTSRLWVFFNFDSNL